MNKLLFQIHRWGGVALALFMAIWFTSGLVIMYAAPSALTPSQQLVHREWLRPEAGWLSLGQAWARGGLDASPDQMSQARLARLADTPYWLIETSQGQRLALSALDGQRHRFSPDEARAIAARWLQSTATPTPLASLRVLDTGPQDSSVRNMEALRPFHRVAVGDSGRELLISERTGEVIRDSDRFERGLYWIGNWIHLMRWLDSVGLGAQRQTILAWLGSIAFVASLTGLIIGWQRWRPGWGGRPTYSQGRRHPYRDVWNTWHFWVGLIGGSAALLWALSGALSTNPFNVFSPATPTKPELARYLGKGFPAWALNWAPNPSSAQQLDGEVVELSWKRLGSDATLLAVGRDGRRAAVAVSGATQGFSDAQLKAAAQRLYPGAKRARIERVDAYDSYYYPRHRQDAVDRPLPVWKVSLDDPQSTQLYLDPQDGQLLLRADQSRRAYRWLYSALHHWDFGWLYSRPIWDAWMLPLVLMGIVLGGTSVVLGYKRLQTEYRTQRKKAQKRAQARAKARAAGQEPTSAAGLPPTLGSAAPAAD